MAIQETRDRALLRRILARDPIGAIYLLGDLAEPDFAHTRWWVDEDRGLLLLFTALAVPMVVPFGEAAALARAVDLPPRFYTKLTANEQPLFARYTLAHPEDLYVMGLETLAPVPPPPGIRIERVTDGAAIGALYDDYPGNFFAPERVPDGVYLAATLDGQPVAAAGTHAWAHSEHSAVLGNVVTAAPARGRGIARALVAQLCLELQSLGCRHIGLHVHRTNSAAIRCYRSIGFTIHSETTQFLCSAPGVEPQLGSR